jgi:hypothetical protein
MANDATDGGTVRLPAVLVQPVAADDVASAVRTVALAAPVNGTVEVVGPEQFRFDEFVRRDLIARGDPRVVVADPHARYFGTELDERSLVPGDGARLGTIRYEGWFAQHFADMNWDVNGGAPSFVTDPPGHEIEHDPIRFEVFKDYVRNIAPWLAVGNEVPSQVGGRT